MRAHADSVYMIYIIGIYIDTLVPRPFGRPDTGQNTYRAHSHEHAHKHPPLQNTSNDTLVHVCT